MDEIMNRIGEVYEPFKVHFLHKPSARWHRTRCLSRCVPAPSAAAICTLRAGCTRLPRCP